MGGLAKIGAKQADLKGRLLHEGALIIALDRCFQERAFLKYAVSAGRAIRAGSTWWQCPQPRYSLSVGSERRYLLFSDLFRTTQFFYDLCPALDHRQSSFHSNPLLAFEVHNWFIEVKKYAADREISKVRCP